MASKPPKNWPPHVIYLTAPFHSKLLTAAQKSVLVSREADTPVVSSGPATLSGSHNVRILPIKDAKHPASGQYGLFATRTLQPGSWILIYLGEVHPESEEYASSDYDLSLDRDHGLAVDAARRGNEARFINDFRGIADKPNAEFREVWSEKFRQRCMAVYVLPQGRSPSSDSKGIAKGNEVLVSYGRGFWSQRAQSLGRDVTGVV